MSQVLVGYDPPRKRETRRRCRRAGGVRVNRALVGYGKARKGLARGSAGLRDGATRAERGIPAPRFARGNAEVFA